MYHYGSVSILPFDVSQMFGFVISFQYVIIELFCQYLHTCVLSFFFLHSFLHILSLFSNFHSSYALIDKIGTGTFFH